jgi:type VI secretion system protein ImpK
MNWQPDDSDPTIVKRLSPRARTALAVQEADDDPTVVVQRNVAREPEQAAASGSPLQSTAALLQQLEADPERKLARAAAPLLLIVAQLRNSVERADVPALRRQVIEEIDRFQQVTQKDGIEAGDIIAARYVLCSTLDETVLMTPWGSRSEWSANSLLNHYHSETWGGEKVFTILDRVKANAGKKLPLLVLIHACLMLGFEGKFRVLERGRDQLEELRNEVSRLIKRNSRSSADEPLSRTTRGTKGGKEIGDFMPLWMVGIASVMILLIVHGYADFTMSGILDPVLTRIDALAGEKVP